MSNRRRRERLPTVTDDSLEASIEAKLKRTDRAVLKYLRGLARKGNRETCKASLPQIAKGSDVSARQVQISTHRLIKAGLLEKLGRDQSNPDFKERGTHYKIVRREAGQSSTLLRMKLEETIEILTGVCTIFEASLEQIVVSQERAAAHSAETALGARQMRARIIALKKKLMS